MCPGITADLQSINDTRKTGIIDRELNRLKIDIACLQETRLPDSGSLKETNYTFFWKGRPRCTKTAWGRFCYKEYPPTLHRTPVIRHREDHRSTTQNIRGLSKHPQCVRPNSLLTHRREGSVLRRSRPGIIQHPQRRGNLSFRRFQC